ncbi:protein phosphatase CheZ [Candidatus Nitrotoga sp. AM1P]|uniref:protein phosphatase CheZ n=1 Tax=Candidatus Nitrotoga sp. AM1P TaxID=2559597 RepID=UPI0010B42FE1|nr:protein phosphatase CheZ [Candidatus Nitrotoga sp. AM1P]BBJ24718.1 chemotaxis regulator CheZ [Candidatus Nitrotoga sp. AM1P]
MTKKAVAGDSDDLEALFDSIVSASDGGKEETAVTSSSSANRELTQSSVEKSSDEISPSDSVVNKLGQMTRKFHDTLHELGYGKDLEKVASFIPDARDRLSYVVTMTEKAAERVLNATEAAQPIVTKIEVDSQRLAREWQMLFDKQLDTEQFKNLVTQTHAFLVEIPKQTKVTNAHLTEIMMAQDFQDLTGQVIKKIVDVTQQMEKQLVELLVESSPPIANPDMHAGLLNGPVINASGRTDVVSNQNQVDDLLESMGF